MAPMRPCVPASPDRRVFHRRVFGALTGLMPALAGCGGGSADPWASDASALQAPPEPEDGVSTRATPLPQLAGMFGLAPWPVTGPLTDLQGLKSLNVLADGRLALAWAEAPSTAPRGPWRLRLQMQGCGGACGSRPLTLIDELPDPDAAVSVRPDGSTLVVWREQDSRRVGVVTVNEHRLQLQRFDPAGFAIAPPELVDGFTSITGPQGESRSLGVPRLDHWPGGGFVVAWPDIQTRSVYPGLLAEAKVRRYHANGWPVDLPQTVTTSEADIGLSLAAWSDAGGYVISQLQHVGASLKQNVLAIDLWNPLPAGAVADLLPGSFLLSLGVFGSVLFAARMDTRRQMPVYVREYFSYEGQLGGRPVPLPALPTRAIALREIEFLVLRPSDRPGRAIAQRMDKYGRLFGSAVDWPEGPSVRLPDGSVAVAWMADSGAGQRRLWLQRFMPTRVMPAPPIAVA